MGDRYMHYYAYLPRKYLIAAVAALASATTGIVCIVAA
jgi:hypothetical protein